MSKNHITDTMNLEALIERCHKIISLYSLWEVVMEIDALQWALTDNKYTILIKHNEKVKVRYRSNCLKKIWFEVAIWLETNIV